jgi:iron complex outermembrane receptor protein
MTGLARQSEGNSSILSAAALLIGLSGIVQGARADIWPPVSGGVSAHPANVSEEIVVTARQRKEKAQEVPISLTVVGGASLAATSTVRIEDIQARLPDINVAMLNPRQNSIAVRGLGNNPANDGLEASTGVFLDGVYLGRPGMAIFDFNDIDQLEYLRGPQGTLFGKNATAGALNVTTKLPSYTFGGSAEITVGNYNDQQYLATVTGPLVENVLAARLSVYDHTRDGIVENVATGGRNTDIGRQGGRLSFLLDANDDLSFRLIADYNREHDSVGASTFYDAAPNNTLFSFYQTLANAGYHVIPAPNNPFQTNINDLQTISVQQGGLTLQGDWTLPNDYKITSITGGRFWNFSPHNDDDATNLPLFEMGVQNHDQQVSQELRVSSLSDDSTIDYTAGLYYFWQEQHTNQYGTYSSNPATALAFGPQFVGARQTMLADLHTHSYAAFAQADCHIQQDLTLTGGLRYTIEEKTMALYRNLDHTVLDPAVPNVDSTGVSPKSSNLAATIALAYQIEPDINLYTSFAHGAKAGATNNSPPPSVPLATAPLVVYPEKADDLEIGAKTEPFDRQLVLNIDAFYSLIRNYQATSFYIDPSNPAAAGSVLTNVGAVRTRGIEAEATARAFEGLTLNTNVSYDNASYQSFRKGPCAAEFGLPGSATCDLTGRPVVGAPRWIFGLDATYEFPVTDDIQGYVISDFTWRSAFYSVIDDSAYSKIGNYGVVNLRVGAKFYDQKMDVSFWSKNLGDRTYFQTLGISTPHGAYFGFPGDPLTFGATIRVSM